MQGNSSDRRASDHLWFAFFICLVGLALLFITVAGFLEAPAADDSGWNDLVVGGLMAAAAGTAGLFFGVHGSALEDRLPELNRRLLLYATVVGAALLIASAAMLTTGVRKAAPASPSTMTQFALTVPVPATPDETASDESRAAAASVVDRNAMIFWSVEPEAEEGHAGLLPMALASCLIVAFGLVYPAVSMTGDEEGKGLVGKLVVPALGFILFGIGAGERIGAEERRQDAQLVAQGLPPVISVPESQRRAVILRAGDEARPTSHRLEAALSQIEISLRGGSATGSARPPLPPGVTRAWLEDQVAILREEIRRGPPPDRNGPVERAQLRQALQEGFRASEETMKRVSHEARQEVLNGMRREELASLCAVLNSQMAAAENQRSMVVAVLRDADRRDLVRRAFLSLAGSDRDREQRYRDFARDAQSDFRMQLALERRCAAPDEMSDGEAGSR